MTLRPIAAAAGWSGRIVTVPDAELPSHLQAGFDPACHLVTDTARLRALGFSEATSRADALARQD